MTTMIDTLQIARTLAEAGMERTHAEAIAGQLRSVADSGREDIVTRSHLDTRLLELESKLSLQNADLRGELKDIRGQILWSMLGMQLALVAALMLLANFTSLLS
jgi:hypothetical protein